MKKRVLSWLLPTLLLCLLPVAAWAAGDSLPAAQDDVITLTEDVTLADKYTVSEDTTIDLNGFTLQVDKGIVVSNNSQEVTLTIQDTSKDQKGKVVSTGASRTIDVQSGEAFILKGGTIESFDSTSAVDVRSGATFIMEDGAILGKTTEGSKNNSEGLRTSSSSVATIKKGSISSMKKYAVDAEGIVTIGEENAAHALINISGINCYTKNANLKIYSGHIGKLEGQAHKDSVLGGIYREANIDALPVGKTYKAVSDGFVIENLTEANAVAKIGNDLYASASMAASQLKDGETLILLADVIGDTNDALIKSTKANNVTIDLNGHDVINNNNGAKSKGIVLQGKIQNANGTMAIVNTGNQPVKVQATVPMDLSISNATTYTDTVTIAESIQLICNDGSNNCLVLSSGLILKYSDTLADMIVEGGFKCDKADGSWIYTGIKAAFENDIDHTVELLNAYKATSPIKIEGTLDLCGNTITYSAKVDAAIMLDQENQALTVKNGSINVTYPYDPNKKPKPDAAPYTASGALLMSNNQSLTLDNVKLTTAGGFGISGNGTNENNTITLLNGSVVTTTAEGFSGIYFPCSGTLTIDNSEVHGMANGVQMCNGRLEVCGDKTRITASGKDESASKTGDGPIPDGAAISIVKRGGGYGDVRATIKGGQFESVNAEAVNAFTWDAKNKKQEAWDNTNKAVQVQGGHFSSSVDESLLDETLTVELKETVNKKDTYSYHQSVEDAMAQAAGDEAEIKDLTKPAPETDGVKVTLNSGCTELANVTMTVAKDGTLTLPSPSRNGYRFDGWQAQSGTIYKGGDSLKVESNMVLTALWSKVNVPVGPSNPSYQITTPSVDNGSVTVSHDTAKKGELVTITVTPDVGYVVDTVAVVDKNGQALPLTDKGNGTYTFTMPNSKVEIVVTFKVGSGLPFTDVHANDWFYGPVEYVFANGIMNGTGDGTTFSPNVPLNRAMMAAVLYNMEGGPAVDNDGAFTDVPNGEWYTDAVNWAASEGIVGGIGDGLYAPNANLTREQMASVLYRYAQYKGIDVSKRADLATFVDGTTVSPWATEVVQWAVAEKLINGAAGNTLQPQGIATRAQVATVLMNFCENVAK